MDNEVWPGIVLLIAALGLLAFAVAAEAAIIARFRSQATDRRGRSRLEALQQYVLERQLTLSSLALARNLAIVGITAIAVFLVIDASGHNWLALMAAALGTVAGLTLFQALPRLIVSRDPERWHRKIGPFVFLTRQTLGWLARLLDLPVALALRLRRLHNGEGADEAEQLLRLAELEEAPDLIPMEERAMIRSIMKMEETTAREIMVPRIDVVAVDVNATLDEVVRLIVERGYSRIPVYEETIDNIVGVVHAKQVLRSIAGPAPPGEAVGGIRQLMRPAHFIPETKRVDELLSELRLNKVSIAIVVDEYGGTAGLVTLEDVVEEIVGEIADEFDVEEEPVQQITSDEVIVDGKVSIDTLSEIFDVEIERNDFDTVGGFIFNQLGKMPSVGDEIRVDGLQLKVLSVLGRRIKKVRVMREALPAMGSEHRQSES
ncbi:MAG TPA: hemolysin family protein [Dehalococcoidia bacterium]|nr:hemolysin family protein [Dehalococcoidia bacterium]